MPTGYTVKLMKDGQTFNDFVMGCARAMGACITLQNERSDIAIPKKFEPPSYYTEQLKKEKVTLKKLLNVKDKESHAKSCLDSRIRQKEKYKASQNEENIRLSNMAQLVGAWLPPTSEHNGLRNFMLDQLRISQNSSKEYVNKEIERIQQLKSSPLNYFEQLLIEAHANVQLAQKSLDEKVARCQSNTDWIQALRKSL